MRKLTAALAVAVMLAWLGAPAQADHSVSLGHVNAYWWAGNVQNGDCQAMWVFERSGDPTVRAATQEFVNAYNADTINRGLQCIVPYLSFYPDDASIGACFDGAWGFPGASFMTVCARGGPDSAAGVSVAYANCGGCHYSHLQPNVLIQRGYPDYRTTYTHVAHEIMHAVGLAHSGDPNSLMYWRSPVGVAKQLNEHDWTALIQTYYHHRGCCI